MLLVEWTDRAVFILSAVEIESLWLLEGDLMAEGRDSWSCEVQE